MGAQAQRRAWHAGTRQVDLAVDIVHACGTVRVDARRQPEFLRLGALRLPRTKQGPAPARTLKRSPQAPGQAASAVRAVGKARTCSSSTRSGLVEARTTSPTAPSTPASVTAPTAPHRPRCPPGWPAISRKGVGAKEKNHRLWQACGGPQAYSVGHEHLPRPLARCAPNPGRRAV